MKILVLADTDEVMGTWEGGDAKADVLVACGDIQTSLILEAAKACRCRSVFAIKGNHDDAAPFPHPIQDLHMNCADHDGLTFGGFGGCIRYKP
ncbi:MAG: metallophosphoesterase family protein, partial [Verrucomicrobiia bacterium]